MAAPSQRIKKGKSVARRKTNHLVCEYLEHIDRKMLVQYQDIVREFIRGRHGIYALYKGNRLYYVGLASNLRSRPKEGTPSGQARQEVEQIQRIPDC